MTHPDNFVRRRPNEKYLPECTQKIVKHPQSVMIWACLDGQGPGPIYFVEGTMRQDQYKMILETVLLPHIASRNYIDGSFLFMQDSAPCHTAKSVITFLNSKNIPLLDWPGNSPDLNPIENVWSTLKSIVYSLDNTNVAKLKENIFNTWHNDKRIKDMIIKCIQSMPQRITECIKAKGCSTKY